MLISIINLLNSFAVFFSADFFIFIILFFSATPFSNSGSGFKFGFSSGIHSDSDSEVLNYDFALSGKPLGSIFLFPNNLIIFLLSSYSFVTFNETSSWSFLISLVIFFGKKLFILLSVFFFVSLFVCLFLLLLLLLLLLYYYYYYFAFLKNYFCHIYNFIIPIITGFLVNYCFFNKKFSS